MLQTLVHIVEFSIGWCMIGITLLAYVTAAYDSWWYSRPVGWRESVFRLLRKDGTGALLIVTLWPILVPIVMATNPAFSNEVRIERKKRRLQEKGVPTRPLEGA